MQKQINKEIPILKDIKFVGVTFDPDNFKKGEDELNKAIEMRIQGNYRLSYINRSCFLSRIVRHHRRKQYEAVQ